MIDGPKRSCWLFVATLFLCSFAGISQAQTSAEQIPAGRGNYADLVELFGEFHQFVEGNDQRARRIIRDDSGRAIEPITDHSRQSIAGQLEQLGRFQARLEDMNVVSWERSQQADYLAVRSRLDQQSFILQRIRAWARDPGFYVDRMLRVTFTELPVEGEAREEFLARIRSVPVLVEEAQKHLDDVAADYADLAIHNLNKADGVGHGFPYRAVPPAGVLGWYDDLIERAAVQPELLEDIAAARASVQAFDAWMEIRRPDWTAQAGVGEKAFDWYLKHVKLMPWTSKELVLLGRRELDRLWADYALERNRNRAFPELEPAASAAEYQRRIDETDRRIRAFLQEQNIITVPGDIGELDTNAPWIVRPGGRNFWEEIQFRDPSPDHLHAVIPGHRFDAIMAARNADPVRGEIFSDVRAEGWATYLEEAMLQAGLFEDRPRVRELIQIFGIFRAARVPADVWLQTRQMTVDQVVDYWLPRVPYLDRNVARVDAEIYLRRPPGYGIGYTVGALQMQRLLADRKRQLGDAFDLRAFHDELMSNGRLQLSLARWEMTGLDDEVRIFWQREPMPESESPD
ncbi:MAG: DUF885 family protein [Xanthomonadales bacterium]|nr:DUF885 family protein [Xanthomonadales bacterium]